MQSRDGDVPTDQALTQSLRRSKARFTILALVTLGTTINYLDRSVMGVAAPSLSADLGLSAAVMGIVFSAFSWSYTAAQIPGGMFLDRFGTRVTYFLSLSVWSLFTAAHGLVSGLGSLIGCRLGLGVAEAPCFPTNSRILCTWFPQHERARANSAYSVGQYFGLAFLSPLLFWIVSAFGWRTVFIAAGSVGSCSRRSGTGFTGIRTSRIAPTGPNCSTSRRAAASGADAPRRSILLARHLVPAEAAPDPGRIHRSVRGQFDPRVLPDLVSDLPCNGTPDGLAQGRRVRDAALHGRLVAECWSEAGFRIR